MRQSRNERLLCKTDTELAFEGTDDEAGFGALAGGEEFLNEADFAVLGLRADVVR